VVRVSVLTCGRKRRIGGGLWVRRCPLCWTKKLVSKCLD